MTHLSEEKLLREEVLYDERGKQIETEERGACEETEGRLARWEEGEGHTRGSEALASSLALPLPSP